METAPRHRTVRPRWATSAHSLDTSTRLPDGRLAPVPTAGPVSTSTAPTGGGGQAARLRGGSAHRPLTPEVPRTRATLHASGVSPRGPRPSSRGVGAEGRGARAPRPLRELVLASGVCIAVVFT